MRGKTGADREISVNTYTGGFTTMLNHHLRNRNLSLKAVGLLSKMLSLPEGKAVTGFTVIGKPDNG